MNSFLSILLAFLYLFSATELSELTKLPSLWEHYQMHKEEANENMDIWSFLKLHYSQEEHHDDHEHHLPFQDCADHMVLNLPAIWPQATSIAIENSFVFISSHWPHCTDFLPSELTFDIWNPPQ